MEVTVFLPLPAFFLKWSNSTTSHPTEGKKSCPFSHRMRQRDNTFFLLHSSASVEKFVRTSPFLTRLVVSFFREGFPAPLNSFSRHSHFMKSSLPCHLTDKENRVKIRKWLGFAVACPLSHTNIVSLYLFATSSSSCPFSFLLSSVERRKNWGWTKKKKEVNIAKIRKRNSKNKKAIVSQLTPLTLTLTSTKCLSGKLTGEPQEETLL